MNVIFWAVFAVAFIILSVIVMVVWHVMVYNIPATILKYTGDKRRPMMVHRKGRKKIINGVPHLWIRGYRDPVRDFFSNNYYPSPKSKHGGLMLFEFEDGKLTPLSPTIARRKLTPEQKKSLDKALDYLEQTGVVDFEYSEDMMKQLRLKIVDDVDADFFVQNLARQHKQYQSGFDRFMAILPWGMIAFIAMLGLVGFIMWLKEDPTNAAKACISNIKPLLERAAETAVPPG